MSDKQSDRERMARIATLFEKALTMDTQACADMLDQIDVDDSQLVKELRSLLDAHGAAGDFLETGAASVPDVHSHEAALQVGTRIGPYRIVEEIGRGGMGIVYAAQRDDGQFDQRVALKIVRRGLNSDALRARFVTERQILAHLEHPNIARLIDGGITQDGQPWFALEHVEGDGLLDYKRNQQLDVDACLHLFLDICEAVRHAHGKLIVHRDLKPANILIDKDGRPKLLDFGIAKLLELDGSGVETQLTQLGMRPLTPDYAAPEQVRGEPVTTAVDIYALGVILYELLCDQRPLALSSHDPLATARAICEEQPTAPSRLPGARPKRARRLRGDLDDIVLKALRKEPEQRYSSVERFADDVRCHLAGLPVSARRDSRRYRVGKFVRRHRAGLAIAAAMFALLVGGLATTTWQARIAAAERDKARLEAAKAGQVKDLIIGLFEEADPNISAGDELTARELLDAGVERVRDGLVDQPEVQAELLTTIGVSYRALGQYEQAGELLEAALTTRRALWPDGHEDLASSLNDVANVHHFTGDYDKARTLYEEALTMRRALPGEHEPAVAETLNDLGVLIYQQGDPQAAEPYYRQAYDIRLQYYGAEHANTLASENNLGGLLHTLGHDREANKVLTRNVAGWRKLHGDVHPDVADALALLARTHLRLNQYDEAETLLTEALAIRRKVYKSAHPSIASSLNGMAALHSDRGNFKLAEKYMRETLDLDRQLLGAQHPYVAGDLQRLATAIAQQGRYADALPVFAESLALNRAVRAADHPSTGTCLRTYADALSRAGRAQEALPLVDEALAIATNAYGAQHANVALTLATRGLVLNALGRPDLAATQYREALTMQQQILTTDNAAIATTLIGLADVELGRNRTGEALGHLREAARIRRAALPAGDKRIAEALAMLAAASGR